MLAPGMGDSIQAAKAGILEIADVFVVNKADRDGADQTVRDLREQGVDAAGEFRPDVVPPDIGRPAHAEALCGRV